MSHPVSWPLRMIDWYQRSRHGQPSPCRFTPSCSEFAREAFELYGTRHGLWLTLRRLLRCRPFGPSGYDPVPLPRDPGTVPPASGSRRLQPLRGLKAREDLMTR